MVSKKKKGSSFFGRNRKFKRFFRPKSGGLQKKKKVFTEIETDFSAEIVRFRLVGGMHPPPKSATDVRPAKKSSILVLVKFASFIYNAVSILDIVSIEMNKK